MHFGVRLTGALVKALADDDAVGGNDDRANERVRAGAAAAAGGVKERPLHHSLVERLRGHHFSWNSPST
jgi:hypothetical protein